MRNKAITCTGVLYVPCFVEPQVDFSLSVSGASSRRASSALRRATGTSEIDGMLRERSVKDQQSCYHRRTAFIVHGIRQWTAVRSMVCQRHWTILTPSSTHQINLHPIPVTQKGDSCYCCFRIIPESRPSIAQVHAPGTSRRKFSWCTLQLLMLLEGMAVRCNWRLARVQRGQRIRRRLWGVVSP